MDIEPKMWPTTQAHDAQGPKTPEQIATMRAKTGAGVRNLNEAVLEPTPSSTCSPAMAGSPLPSRPLWPTPAVNDMGESKTPEQWDAWTAAMQARHANGNGHGPSLSIEARRSAPSPSPRSSPMPAPSSPIGGLMCPTSAPFRGLPASEFYANAVSSRLSSLVAFLASRTASPASDSPAATPAISGTNAPECFGSYVPASPSLRTSEGSSVPNHLPRMVKPARDFFSTEFCQTWPKSGMLANGKLYPLPTLERPTGESGSGSSASMSEVSAWPTPIASDSAGESQSKISRIQSGEQNVVSQLREAVFLTGPPPTASGPPDPDRLNTVGSPREQWATPQRHDAQGPKTPEQIEAMRARTGAGVKNLNEQVQWPTPAASTESGGPHGLDGGTGARSMLTPEQATEFKGGKLNPSWVETLMGVPLGWTQLPRKFTKPRTTR